MKALIEVTFNPAVDDPIDHRLDRLKDDLLGLKYVTGEDFLTAVEYVEVSE